MLGDRDAVIGRELTKRHEEFLRGPLAELRRRVATATLRGEVTVLIAGAHGTSPVATPTSTNPRRAGGRPRVSELATEVARRTGRPRRACSACRASTRMTRSARVVPRSRSGTRSRR